VERYKLAEWALCDGNRFCAFCDRKTFSMTTNSAAADRPARRAALRPSCCT